MEEAVKDLFEGTADLRVPHMSSELLINMVVCEVVVTIREHTDANTISSVSS